MEMNNIPALSIHPHSDEWVKFNPHSSPFPIHPTCLDYYFNQNDKAGSAPHLKYATIFVKALALSVNCLVLAQQVLYICLKNAWLWSRIYQTLYLLDRGFLCFLANATVGKQVAVSSRGVSCKYCKTGNFSDRKL